MSQVQTQRHPLVLAGIVIFITGILAAAAFGLNSVTNPQPQATTAASTVCAKAPSGHPNLKPVRSHSAPPTTKLDPAIQYFGTICTARGLIVFKFRTDTAPITSGNFIALADSGFYDGLNFHRVCPNPADQSCGGSLTIAQGGDPQGDGRGGPGYSIADEGPKGPYSTGTFAMARAAQISGSQFFINTGDNTSGLASPQSPVYNLFADITQGLDVAQSLKKGDVMFWVAVSRTPVAAPSPAASAQASPAPTATPSATPTADTSSPSPSPS